MSETTLTELLENAGASTPAEETAKQPLDSFATNLNELAAQGIGD